MRIWLAIILSLIGFCMLFFSYYFRLEYLLPLENYMDLLFKTYPESPDHLSAIQAVNYYFDIFLFLIISGFALLLFSLILFRPRDLINEMIINNKLIDYVQSNKDNLTKQTKVKGEVDCPVCKDSINLSDLFCCNCGIDLHHIYELSLANLN